MTTVADQEMRRILDMQALEERLLNKALKIKGKNILLYGPPGTGKTTNARRLHAADFDYISMISLTIDTPAAEGRGFFMPVADGKGGTGMGWQDGVGVKAMGKVIKEDGTVKLDKPNQRFIINEIHKAGPDFSAFLHALADDRNIAEIHLPNGDVVFSQPDLQIIATSNEPPEALDEPITDRFTIRIKVDLPTEEAIEALDEDVRDWCLKSAPLYYTQRSKYISYREIKTFCELRGEKDINSLEAAQLIWPGRAEDIIASAKILGVDV